MIKFLPTRFTSRLAVILLLFGLVFVSIVFIPVRNIEVSKQPSLLHKDTLSSKLLVSNNVIKVLDDDAPHMYADYVKDPDEFDKKWQDRLQNWHTALKPGIAISNSKITDEHKTEERKGKKRRKPADADAPSYAVPKIRCNINSGGRRVDCLKKGNEIYMPFKFISEYFEVYGEANEDGRSFQFSHSKAPIWLPQSKYQPDKAFLFFEEYDVDKRSKVELISGQYGVPVSNQWDSKGYIYPIQVVQFGLSHFSKYLMPGGNESDKQSLLEDGSMGMSTWIIPENCKRAVKTQTYSEQDRSAVVSFNVPDDAGGDSVAYMNISETRVDSCVSLDVKFILPNSSVSIVLDTAEGHFVLTYVSDTFYKKVGVEDMQYGIGACTEWCTLHRNVMVDLRKFIPKQSPISWSKLTESIVSISRLEVRGQGEIDNVRISESCHLGHFKAASDWILHNQNAEGGWPVSVTRNIANRRLTLEPGWYSAMAQGHGISILVRAYTVFKDINYIKAAEKALTIYQKLSKDKGVLARFLDKYDWYEEYPTDPPLFVLNGFIYSLFGLYDLSKVGTGDAQIIATKLYKTGINSLKVMLPLYDSGTGSFYDLRHVTVPHIAPNRARWDYHAVHISQLYNLGLIEPHPIFNNTADRWLSYASGKRAPHN